MTDLSGQPQARRQPHILAAFETADGADTAMMYLDAEAIPRERVQVRAPNPAAPGAAPAAAVPETPALGPDDRMPDGTPLTEEEQTNTRVLRTSTVGVAAAFAGAGAVIATGGAALPAVAAAVVAGTGAGGLSELASKVASGAGLGSTAETASPEEGAAAILVVDPENEDQAERARGVLKKVATLRVWEEDAEDAPSDRTTTPA